MKRETRKGMAKGRHILIRPPYEEVMKREQEKLAYQLKKKTGNRRARVGIGSLVEWMCEQLFTEDAEFAEYLEKRKQIEELEKKK